MLVGVQEAPRAAAPVDGYRTMTVLRKQHIANGIVLLELAPPEGESLPVWEPGAHIDLHLSEDLVRQYSLCGDAAAPTWQVAVLREPHSRGGSAYVHDELREGDTIAVSGPRNHFALKDADEYLFVAGGIGITPILPMLAAVHQAGKPWRLVYGGRSAETMAFRDQLAHLYGDQVEFKPQDTHGILDIDELVSNFPGDGRIYTCGPGGMLKALEDRCSRPSSPRLHLERFVAKEVPVDVPDPAFDVVLQLSDKRLRVEAGQTILEAVEAEGVYVESQCRVGTCGTCETRVLEGTPEHRDSLLDEVERETGDTMMICVSRAQGQCLVLDL